MTSKIAPRFITSFAVGGSTYLHATETFYGSSGYCYQGDIIEYPTVQEALADRFWGAFAQSTVTVRYTNRDGAWHTLINAQELRGVEIELKYYDSVAQTTPTTIVKGKIKSWNVTDMVELVVEVHSLDVLETILPKKLVNTEDFPTATDLGAPVNIIFGQAKDVPLPYILHESSNDFYDYLICQQETSTVDAVYRDGVLVSTGEYTFYNVSSTDNPHTGFACLRFTKEQKDFFGKLYSLTADINMPSRNFAGAMKTILSSSDIGLSESVSTDSFATASTDLDTIGNMYCDGHISKERHARDILDDLAMMCRGSYKQNTDGEWTLDIDTYSTSINASFGHKDGYYNNILNLTKRTKTPSNEALKSVTLRYGRHSGKYEYENKRNLFAFGIDKVFETPFVQDHNTADKITCYFTKLAEHSDEHLELIAGEDARNLNNRDIVNIDIPDWSIDKKFRIEEIGKGESTVHLALREYSSNINVYSTGTLPAGASKDSNDESMDINSTGTIGDSTGGYHITVGTSSLRIKDGSGTLAKYGATVNFYDPSGIERAGIGASGAFLGNSGEGEYVFVDATNGVRLYSNSTLMSQLKVDGTAYFGDQSNEHVAISTAGVDFKDGATLLARYANVIYLYAGGVVKVAVTTTDTKIGDANNEHIVLSASGLEIKDGPTTLATYTSTITIGQVAASQDNILISSGAIYLRNNTTNIFSITNSGVSSLNMLAGSNIVMKGDGLDYSLLQWDGSTYDINIYADTTGTTMNLSPATTNACYLYFGGASNRWKSVQFWTQSGFAFGTTSYIMQLVESDAAFFCGTDSAISLGKNTTCFTDVYADAGVTACSDTRWKTILGQEPLGLDFVCRLPFIEYLLNKNGKKRQGVYRGITGQDLEQALIECNYNPKQFAGLKYDKIDGKEWLSIMYEQLISPLGVAIQELCKIHEEHLRRYH